MATSAFKSNSRRGYANSEQPNSPNKVPPPRKRSLSVSAVSRNQMDTPSEFLNKRDNPLFWASGGSPPDKETQDENPSIVVGGGASKLKSSTIGQRGRSVTRNSDLGNKKEIARSLSRVDNGRRGRSVSRGNSAYRASENEVEQDSISAWNYGSGSNSNQASSTIKKPISVRKAACTQDRIRSAQSQSDFHPALHPSVDSAVGSSHLKIPNWEDGISTGSLSEAEEKTIKAVYEQMKSFRGDNLGGEAATSGIYETVRSEVRRAISDIQNDLESALRRNNTTAIASAAVTDIPPNLVKPGAVELVLDIRREYAKKLEESQERARKLRSDLAVEEHRGQELSRILKETLPDPKTSTAHRSRLGRRISNERKKMSKRLTDEAMSYFDECVSISTFDSSDFSAAEDSAFNSLGTTLTVGGSTSLPKESPCVSVSCGQNSCLNHKQLMHTSEDSGLTANSSCNEPMMDQASERGKNTEWGRKFSFSFGHKPTESIVLQQDIKNYIRNFEKDVDREEITSEIVRSNYYDVDAYDLQGRAESLLFDRVFFKNSIESGSLHICSGGIPIPFLPFASFI